MPGMKRLTENKDWRVYFSEMQLQAAENYVRNGNYRDFRFTEYSAEAVIGQGRANTYRPFIMMSPQCYSEDWDPKCFHCTCSAANPRPKRYSYWYTSEQKKTCSHEAALLMLWEKQHGPWNFTETEEECRERIERERYEADLTKWKKRREKESKDIRSAAEWNLPVEGTPEDLFFPLPSLISERKTTLFDLNSAREHIENNEIRLSSDPKLIFDRTGKQNLQCHTKTENRFRDADTTLTVGRDFLGSCYSL